MKPQRKPEADIQIRINCGCGFKCNHMHEAINHTMSTGHILEIKGEIAPLSDQEDKPSFNSPLSNELINERRDE